MKKLKTIVSFAAVLVVMLFGLAGPAFALSGADQCYLVITHVSTTLNTMHDVGNNREAAYNDAAARVAKQLEAAQNAGYDITQLQADYKTLNSDLAQFRTDRQTLEVDLTNVQTAAQTDCGSDNAQLMDALKAARTQLTVVRADDVKIRVDVRQKLIPDIRAYLTWLKSKTTNTGATFN